MDISSVGQSRYAERSFHTVPYEQPVQRGYPGGAAGPAVIGNTWAAGPMPGSNRPADSAVWIEEGREKAFLRKLHVSEAGSGLLARLEGQWEMQSWQVRRLHAEHNSLDRMAEAGAHRLRSAVGNLMALTGRVQISGRSVDIYA